jgi:hypothetical protein
MRTGYEIHAKQYMRAILMLDASDAQQMQRVVHKSLTSAAICKAVNWLARPLGSHGCIQLTLAPRSLAS